MTTLVIAEHNNAGLIASTLNTVAAAKAIGGNIEVLVAGEGCQAAADAAAKIEGVSKVLLADNAAYAHQLPENMGLLIAELGKNYSHILASASTNGKNYMPRVAALLDVDQISEISAVESADTFVRPIYAGNAMATVQSSASVKVITVRSTGFDPVAAEGGSASVENVSSAQDAGVSSFVGEELAKSDRPELAGAKIVISGGRYIVLGWGRDFADVTPLKGVMTGGGDHVLTVAVDVTSNREEPAVMQAEWRPAAQ